MMRNEPRVTNFAAMQLRAPRKPQFWMNQPSPTFNNLDIADEQSTVAFFDRIARIATVGWIVRFAVRRKPLVCYGNAHMSIFRKAHTDSD